MHYHDVRGYALLAALMAILLLMSVGIMAMTLSSQDYVMGTRVVVEKKVFSAVQEGVHDLAYHFDPLRAGGNIGQTGDRSGLLLFDNQARVSRPTLLCRDRQLSG